MLGRPVELTFEDLDAGVFGHLFGVLVHGNIEAKTHRILRSLFEHDGSPCDVFLVHRTDVDAEHWDLAALQEVEQRFQSTKRRSLNPDTLACLVDRVEQGSQVLHDFTFELFFVVVFCHLEQARTSDGMFKPGCSDLNTQSGLDLFVVDICALFAIARELQQERNPGATHERAYLDAQLFQWLRRQESSDLCNNGTLQSTDDNAVALPEHTV